ncbi:hypothetical protein EPD60_00445 [Flaviaesturariibacter flavus]|uniref:DUF4625 domain-containing protein n=1 Tax=Flaviaesturariibacter flavus TaxID=2502780 RepID=A0A4R1BR21_9BACT|nr:hypothetical protein [Flaviaesturariibacter flavus]TCJ19625.1 hypothetical protein EPD60_00445 [Flaviaesturariibacter flavus]
MACSKHSGDVEPTDDIIPVATLDIAQPTAGGTYRNGDTVRFVATAISTENIHGYDVFVRKANDTANIWFEHIHDHNDTLRINAYWINDRTAPQSMEANFTLYLDHDGHLLKKSVPFQVQ